MQGWLNNTNTNYLVLRRKPVTERFFRSLKSERVNYKQYKTRAEGMADIADCIESFYNQKRRHSTLGNISPVEYEARQQNVKHVSN